jgi:hypothetical protein
LALITWSKRQVYIAFDNNVASNGKVQKARRDLAEELKSRGPVVHFMKLPEMPAMLNLNGPDDYCEILPDEAILAMLIEAQTSEGTGGGGFIWAPEAMSTFLAEEEPLEPLLEDLPAFKGVVTEIFSPRGLGKTLWAEGVAARLAKAGWRVLLLDRDNPRRMVKQRLKAWGVELNWEKLKAITREKCPPLTRPDLWATFPYQEFDAIILDSLDSMAEGVGEQDSAKPSRAIAPLLDVVRQIDGPAALILGNCVRSGKHSRGSGVIEDRSDISFEVRDATGFSPSSEDWVEQLPLGGAEAWASRNKRRKQRDKYRLAFVASKFRVGVEPPPFVVELDLSGELWTYTNVTDDVDREGAENRKRVAEEQAARLENAAAALKQQIQDRFDRQEPPLLKRQDAEGILMAAHLTRKAARKVLEDRNLHDWALRPDPSDKRVIHILPLGVVWERPHYRTSAEAAQTAGENEVECGRPLFMRPATSGTKN